MKCWKRIHFVGIKGIGISGLAQYFYHLGLKITGSDFPQKFQTDLILNRLKIPITKFSPKNINPNIDLVIYSTAYNKNHPEIKKAKQLNIPQKSYVEILAKIVNSKNNIVVSGTHGKTTTCALCGYLLEVAGFDPLVFCGGIVKNWNSNFRFGKSSWVVTEGDEYQEKFLKFTPDYLLITNVDYDHPDYFPTKKSYYQAFLKLKKKVTKKVFYSRKPSKSFKKFLSQINLSLFGQQNQSNAYLVYRLAKELNISKETIKKAFETFKGVKRRQEIIAKLKTKNSKFETIIIDDYAHHPQEIKATLLALKQKFSEYQILAIFQPHTFSRTKVFLKQFATCFKFADKVYLLPIYSSVRERKGKIDLDKLLIEETRKYHSRAELVRSISGLNKKIKLSLKKNSLIVTLGAGDIWKIAHQLAKKLNLYNYKYFG